MTGAGHVARVGEGRNIYAYSILVGRPQGKDHLRDIGVNGSDNIRTDLKEMRCGLQKWIQLA
jgi:hypothetical protein